MSDSDRDHGIDQDRDRDADTDRGTDRNTESDRGGDRNRGADRDIQPEEALRIAQRALSDLSELEDEVAQLRADHEELAEEFTAAKLRLSSEDDDRDYRQLTREDKVGIVREHGFERAVDGTGKARLDYTDIMWGVFDGEPSTKHCYTLMRLAADVRGFTVRDPEDDSKHLRVDAAEAKRGDCLFRENNTGETGVN